MAPSLQSESRAHDGAETLDAETFDDATADSPAVQHDLVIAANRLPVRRTDDGWTLSPGGLVTAMAAVMGSDGGAWIGWDGEAGGEPLDPFRHGEITLLPFTLTEAEAEDYYGGFANATLWPLYHNALLPISFKRRWWNAYVAVNRKVARRCVEALAPGGTLWVHDYHLQLVPQMVREARPDARIGFFLHTPFPPAGRGCGGRSRCGRRVGPLEPSAVRAGGGSRAPTASRRERAPRRSVGPPCG